MLRTDRRLNPRTRLNNLAYIQIEPNNGGIVLNVSRKGLCFHSIAPVEPNGGVRLSIVEQNRRIPLSAAQVWTDQAKKVSGLCFSTLTEEARQQIQSWIDEGSIPAEEPRSSTVGAVLRRALPSLVTVPFRADSRARRRIERAAARLRLRMRLQWHGFSGGLATGFLLCALVCSILLFGYAHRFQFGESLIRWGERLTGRPQTAGSVVNAPPSIQPSVALPASTRQTPGVKASSATQTLASALPPTSQQSFAGARNSGRGEAPPSSPPDEAAKSGDRNAAATATESERSNPQTAQPGTSLDKSVVPSFRFDSSIRPQRPLFSTPLPMTPGTPPAEHAASPNAFTASSPIAPPAKASTSSTTEMYFELGRFKDQMLAQSVSEKLVQSGFRTKVLEKGHLWLNRYQVLVGPYSQEEETAKAERELLSRGYKPRPYERGSRDFSLSSGLMLNGIRLPGGDFTISWESYLTHAIVKFIQGNDFSTTARGRWVQRGTRYFENEFVYLKNADGSRTLVEVHFSGLDRALAFGNL